MTYKIAFLPYQPSMWDSMASIHTAALVRPNVEARVLTLPYSTLSDDGSIATHSTGDSLGDAVDHAPATWHALTRFDPDIVVIHNIYDEHNRITRVDDDFHTRRLSLLRARLVYVPYLFMGLTVPEAQRDLSSMDLVDTILLPTPAHITQMAERLKPKCLALGSPKADALQGSFASHPPTHQDELTLLIVSSITELLEGGGNTLLRLAELFADVDATPATRAIWRPHPLLLSTILSMRPDLKALYTHLLRLAQRSTSVTVDLNPDYTPSMLAADGCVAMSATSLPLMFSLSGRPVYFADHAAVTYSPLSEEPAPPGRKHLPFGPVDGIHPWACSQREHSVDFGDFLAYLRGRQHDTGMQRRMVHGPLGAVGGGAGDAILSALLGQLTEHPH